MRGSRSRTTGGSCPTAVVERGPPGEVGQDDGDQLTQLGRAECPAGTGRYCSRSPVSWNLAEGPQHQVPVVFAERNTGGHDGADAWLTGDGEPHLRELLIAARRASTNVAWGRTSSAGIPAGTPSTVMRGAPARSCIRPWSLPGESPSAHRRRS